MSKDTYTTSDIYVAALLRTKGLRFLGITKNGTRGIFRFEDRSDRERSILDFYNGQAILNVREYIDNWTNFKKLVERL